MILPNNWIDVLSSLDATRIQGEPGLEVRLVDGRTARPLLHKQLIERIVDPSGRNFGLYRITELGTRTLISGEIEEDDSAPTKPKAIQAFKTPKAIAKPNGNHELTDELIEAAQAARKLASDLALALLVERMPELKGMMDTFAQVDAAVEKARKGR